MPSLLAWTLIDKKSFHKANDAIYLLGTKSIKSKEDLYN
jgi:hypothetical protein